MNLGRQFVFFFIMKARTVPESLLRFIIQKFCCYCEKKIEETKKLFATKRPCDEKTLRRNDPRRKGCDETTRDETTQDRLNWYWKIHYEYQDKNYRIFGGQLISEELDKILNDSRRSICY